MRIWPVFLLLTACGSPAPELDTVKQKIRREFPDVQTVSTKQLAGWLADKGIETPVLLDVRAPDEYSVSHLDGARRALTTSEAMRVLHDVGKADRIVVYCSVGYRSAKLAQALGARGYTDVYNLEGSIFQWANESRPLVHDQGVATKVHPYDENWGRLLDPRWH